MAEAKSTGARLVRPTTNDRGCRWYVAVEGQTSVPFEYEALVEEVQAGRVPFGAHVWRPGFAHWIALGARPDLVAELPDRPSLGLVPASLEAARMMRTEELSFSQDVVEARPELDAAPPTMDLPRVPTLDAVEAEALEALERARPSSGADALDALAAGMAQAEVGAAEPGVTDLAADAPPSLVDIAERLEASAPEATHVSEDIILAEMAHGLRRARRARVALGFTLVALVGGLGFLVWQVESAQIQPRLEPRPGMPPAPASIPEPPATARPPVVRQARLELPETAAPLAAGVEAEAPVGAPAEGARPRAARADRPAPADDSAAAPPTAAPDEGLAWLNRRAPEPEPEPEPLLVNQARAAPRRFRIEAPEPEARLELPVVLPEGLSEERAGRTVAASLSSFASCARLDRLTDRLPAGTLLELEVRSEGRVARARADGAPGIVGRCLERAARKLSFAPFTRPIEQVRVSFARAGTVRTSVLR